MLIFLVFIAGAWFSRPREHLPGVLRRAHGGYFLKPNVVSRNALDRGPFVALYLFAMTASVNAVILDAVRTPIGASMGVLRKWHAVDLLAVVLQEALDRSGIAIADIDHVIGGCATPVGEQALNVTRNAVLAVGWPESIPAHTIDAHASSSMLALHEAVARVSSGLSKVCVVVGVESTRVPEGASTGVAVGKPYGAAVHDRFAEFGGLLPPGVVADRLAHHAGLTRKELDEYALGSLERATVTQGGSMQKAEIATLVETSKKPVMVDVDELHISFEPSSFRPMFENDGLVTAVTYAAPADAAVAVVVAHPDVLKKKQQPLATVRAVGSAGASMRDGDVGADLVRQLLASADMETSDIDRYEVREDSAATPLGLALALGLGIDVVNPNGGALAVGDPVGASGLLAVTSLVHGLDRDNGAAGIALVAGASAVASAVLVTRP